MHFMAWILESSFFFLANQRRNTGSELVNQVGSDVPLEVCLFELKNHSCRVELVAVDRSDLMEYRVLVS